MNKQGNTGAVSADGEYSLRLRELAEPYRRRHLHRAANAIEHGFLLPAGTLPDQVPPAEDSSACSLWPEDFGPRAQAA